MEDTAELALLTNQDELISLMPSTANETIVGYTSHMIGEGLFESECVGNPQCSSLNTLIKKFRTPDKDLILVAKYCYMKYFAINNKIPLEYTIDTSFLDCDSEYIVAIETVELTKNELDEIFIRTSIGNIYYLEVRR